MRDLPNPRGGRQRQQQTQPSSGFPATVDNLEPQAIQGERKTVTALFADIKGSIELMEDLDPKRLARSSTRRSS